MLGVHPLKTRGKEAIDNGKKKEKKARKKRNTAAEGGGKKEDSMKCCAMRGTVFDYREEKFLFLKLVKITGRHESKHFILDVITQGGNGKLKRYPFYATDLEADFCVALQTKPLEPVEGGC